MAASTLFSAAPYGIMAPATVSGQATSSQSRSASPGSTDSHSETSHNLPLGAATGMHIEGESLFGYSVVDSIATANDSPWPKDFFVQTGLLDLQLPTMHAPCETALFASDPELGSDECHSTDCTPCKPCKPCKPFGSKAKHCTNVSCAFCVKKGHLKEKRAVFCRAFNGC